MPFHATLGFPTPTKTLNTAVRFLCFTPVTTRNSIGRHPTLRFPTATSVMMYSGESGNEKEGTKRVNMLSRFFKALKENFNVRFTSKGAEANYKDDDLEGKGRIWLAGKRIFGDLQIQMGPYYAEIGRGMKKSDFNVSWLARHSRYMESHDIQIFEDPTGLTYLVCMAGVPVENVTIRIKGRWMRIHGEAPSLNPWGATTKVVELLLPKPFGDDYEEEDYEVTWYFNQAVIKILRYKNMVKEVSADKVKKEA
ncbi:hypothetical protein QVD17_04885 [Tagetes erecta]|uniref:Uncharacterized protein n=1 Tax=Tagetes erecta TaxID=13708 RepID=A0AAD8LAZ6_TARER|nr:hypothetical protein QVD17_04885 [Tagetes erecta]